MPQQPEKSMPSAMVLHRALIMDEHRRRSEGKPLKYGGVEGVAARMGIAASTVYDWANNRHAIPLWAIPALYAATRDAQLIADLIGADVAGLLVLERPQGQVSSAVLDRDVLALAALVGRAAEELNRANEDGEIDAVERDRIDKKLAAVEQQLAAMRAAIWTARLREGGKVVPGPGAPRPQRKAGA